MEEKKAYYFSYERYHRLLNIMRSVSKLPNVFELTEFDILCSDISHGLIGDYGEVEWKRFGIGMDSFEKLLNSGFSTPLPRQDLERLRALVYWRDHVRELFPEETGAEKLEKFEVECSKQIRSMLPICEEEIARAKSKDDLGRWVGYIMEPVNVSIHGDETYKKVLSYLKEVQREELESEEWQIIHSHLPHWDEDEINHSPFPIEMIIKAARHTSLLVWENIDKTISSEEDIVDTIPSLMLKNTDAGTLFDELRGHLVFTSGRYIAKEDAALTYAMWLTCVYILIDSQDEPYYEEASRISKELLAYIKTIQGEDYPVVSLEYDIWEIMSDLKERKKGQTASNAEEQEETPSEVPLVKPDSSFFGEKFSPDVCEAELLRILNGARTKAAACRGILTYADAGYFVLSDKTDQEKAAAINPWLALTNKKDNPKFVLTEHDFCKANLGKHKR